MKKLRETYILGLFISLLSQCIMSPILRNGFVLWDDDRYVYENVHLRSLDLAFIKWAFTDLSEHFWQPVAWLFHALDHALWGLNPFGHHLTSILLHGVNVFLVVVLLIRVLGEAARVRQAAGGPSVLDDRGILIAVGVAGLLFGIHPLQVEAVAWVTAKHDLLFTVFFLLSVLNYLAYASGRELGASVRALPEAVSRRPYLLSLLFFLLSLAAKPSAVVLPAVLVLLDWHPVRRVRTWKSGASSVIEKLPFIIPGLVVSVVTIIAHEARGGMTSFASVPLVPRILVAAKALVLYLGKIVWPVHLSPFYPYPKDIPVWSFEYLVPAAVLVAVTVLCALAARRRPVFLAVWLYVLVILLPVLGIFKVRDVFMADRYLYLPVLGPFLLLGAAAARGWAGTGAGDRPGRAARGAAAVLAVTVFASLCVITVMQSAVWMDGIALWSRVIDAEPRQAPNAYVSRGWAYKMAGRPEDALADFNKAIELDATSYHAYNDRAVLYRERGQLDRALRDLKKAVELDPYPYLAFSNRAVVLALLGRPDDAIADYSRAISINASYVDAYVGRGLTMAELGRYREALADLDRAVQLNPYSTDAYVNRGVVHERMQRPDLALSDYSKVIDLDRDDLLAYRNRGAVFARLGMLENAVADYTVALELEPDMTDLYVRRAELYRTAGRSDLADRDFREACSRGNDAGCRGAGAP